MPITVRSVSAHLLVSPCRWLLHVCYPVLLGVELCSELTQEQLVVTIIRVSGAAATHWTTCGDLVC